MGVEDKRVFFDSNTGDDEEGYLLVFPQSIEDMDRLASEIKDGLLVKLYMPNELEVTAKLKFDHNLRCWRGIPVGEWTVLGDPLEK